MNQTRKIFKRIATVFLVIGIPVLIYSSFQSPYKNEDVYLQKYNAIAADPEAPDANDRFRALRVEQLTYKYFLDDYSLTLISVGLVLLFLGNRGGAAFPSPSSKLKIKLLGIAAAFVTFVLSVASLVLDAGRGDFPVWADTLTIPVVTELLPLLLISLIWVAAHFYFFRGDFKTEQKIFNLPAIKLKSNLWLNFTALITGLLFLDEVIHGRFLMVVPSCLWVGFYLSLAAGRVKLLGVNTLGTKTVILP